MRAGEKWFLISLVVFIAGGAFTAVKAMPDMTEGGSESQQIEELSLYDLLKEEIRPYHFGNVPSESFSGDTTVLVVDLDCNMFSEAQANLHVTRILRSLDFDHITVQERMAGGIVFRAEFPNDQPLQILFKTPR
ncbi:MAG: hypothetical protein KAH54_05855 [Candidatus Sabulitectum sp.]|nr:hypothetical protein [Candidatus Sabulitectum sp.]